MFYENESKSESAKPQVTPPHTWDDVERKSREDPFFRAAVTMVIHGLATREEALIALAFGLSQSTENLRAELLRRMNLCTCRAFIIPAKAEGREGR